MWPGFGNSETRPHTTAQVCPVLCGLDLKTVGKRPHSTGPTTGQTCPVLCGGEFRAWLVRAVFRANSEQIPSELRVPSNSGQIPSKFWANSEQTSQTLYFLVLLCNEPPWLADNKEHMSPYGSNRPCPELSTMWSGFKIWKFRKRPHSTGQVCPVLCGLFLEVRKEAT